MPTAARLNLPRRGEPGAPIRPRASGGVEMLHSSGRHITNLQTYGAQVDSGCAGGALRPAPGVGSALNDL